MEIFQNIYCIKYLCVMVGLASIDGRGDIADRLEWKCITFPDGWSMILAFSRREEKERVNI